MKTRGSMAEGSIGVVVVGLRELLPRRDHLLGVLVGLLVFVSARVGLTAAASAARVYASHMSDTVVETQYGRLKGVLLDQRNKNLGQVEAYFGLQYASVLGGELRFMPPTSSLEKWDGIRVAVQFRPVCPQRIPSDEELRRRLPLGRVAHLKRVIAFLDKQSEECLNLNIYVPVRDKNETKPLSVVLFIHGESYELGTGNAYDGSVMSAFGHVIVITMNYRLGILGFLSLDDSNAPGNYALLDLVAGLRWIKENIHAFGGNPNQVCLMGHGYGASMVHLLLISPVTKGRDLFQRAIMHSGSALASWSIASEPLRYIDLIVNRTNCSGVVHPSTPSHHRSFLQCLKQIPADDLVRLDIRSPKYLSAFGPTIDQRIVLPADVRSMMAKLSESVFARTKLLVGVARSEGLGYFVNDELERGIVADRMSRMMRTFVQNVFSYHRQSILDVLTHQYTDWERPIQDPAADRDSLAELFGDSQVTASVVELAQYHAQHGTSTYFFVFNAPPRLDVYPRWVSGAPGEDLAYAFGAPVADGISPFPTTYARSDRVLSESVLRYWTNFIRTGDPNIDDESTLLGSSPRGRTKPLDPTWPLYTFNKQEYLIIEKRSPDRSDDGVKSSIRHHFRASKMALWLDLIPKLHKSDDLDARFHQLENSSDRNSFEEDGTRDSVFQPETVDSTFSASTGRSGTTTTTTSSAWSQTTSSRRFTGVGGVRSRRTTPHTVAAPPPPSVESQTGAWVEPSPPAPGGGGAAGGDADHSNSSSLLSLRVTIGIGCALLVLNVLIFAGLCYQKDRVRRDMRMNTRFLDHLLRGKTAAAVAGLDATAGGGGGGHPHDIYSVGPVASSDLAAAAAAIDAADSNGGNSIPRRISVHHHHHHQQQQHQPLQSTANDDDDDNDDLFPQEATMKTTTTSSLRRNSTLNRRSPPYAMVLSSHCLVPPPPPPTTTTNHVDCRDGGGGLLLGYLSAEHGPLPDEHCSSSNPSTVV